MATVSIARHQLRCPGWSRVAYLGETGLASRRLSPYSTVLPPSAGKIFTMIQPTGTLHPAQPDWVILQRQTCCRTIPKHAFGSVNASDEEISRAKAAQAHDSLAAPTATRLRWRARQTLSCGQKQRLAMHAPAARSRILILDDAPLR